MAKRNPDAMILALDLATVIGWCAGRPSEEPHWEHHRLRDQALPNTMIALRNWLMGKMLSFKPELVVIETPPSLRWGGGKTNADTLLKLNAMAIEVEKLCAEQGIECAQVDAAKWKKNMVGTARVSKKQRPYPPIESCAQRGWVVNDHNAADAVGVWLYAVAIINKAAAARFDPLARKVALRGKGRGAAEKAGRSDGRPVGQVSVRAR